MDPASSVSLIGTGIKTVAMLMVVLGVLFGVLWVAKRFMLPNRGKQNRIPISLESSFHLSPKQRIAVVAVGEDMLVLGVTPENINLLKVLPASLKEPDATGKQDHEA
jgi:flagellar protein FliO/FliZ